MLKARAIKTVDEIALLDHAAGVVDAVYEQIYRTLRPGVREHEVVADAQRLLFELGSEQVEAINAVSGDRCNPHPHVFSDRLLRPGDQAFFDIIHSFMGYRTCYYRTFNVGGVSQSQLDAYKQCREWLDAAIELVRPASTTDQIAAVWPTAEELGFPNEEACFGLQFGHGLGVGLYESPMISRLHSLDHPVVIEEGMVFALETYCAASDGRSAARIEEEVVVTADGRRHPHQVPGRGAAGRRQGLRARRRPRWPTPRRGCRRRDRAARPSRRATPGTPEEATHYLELYRRMRLIRRFEDKVQSLFQRGTCTARRTCARARRRARSASCACSATRTGSPAPTAATATRSRSASSPQALMAEMLGRATGRVRRARRLDERDRPRAPADGLLRDRRRQHRRRHRRRAGAQAPAPAAWRSPSSATAPPTRATSTSA